MRGTTRPFVTRGTSTRTASPVSTPRFEASTLAEQDAVRTGLEVLERAALDEARQVRSLALLGRQNPAHDRGPQVRAGREHAFEPHVRRDGRDARHAREAPLRARANRRSLRGAETVACALNASRRVRVSVSRPFNTDRMTISAVTPSARPSSDAAVRNDTSARQRRERR